MLEVEKWLETDEEATGDAAVFLQELRKRAPRWACDPDDTWVLMYDGEVRAYVEVDDLVGETVLFSVRVELVGDRLRCHELDLGDQDVLEQNVHFISLERRGPAVELAAVAAEWVERALSRPVICEEWTWPGGSTCMWSFADDGQLLLGAPPRLSTQQLPSAYLARRHVRGTAAG